MLTELSNTEQRVPSINANCQQHHSRGNKYNSLHNTCTVRTFDH